MLKKNIIIYKLLKIKMIVQMHKIEAAFLEMYMMKKAGYCHIMQLINGRGLLESSRRTSGNQYKKEDKKRCLI